MNKRRIQKLIALALIYAPEAIELFGKAKAKVKATKTPKA